MLRLVGFIVFSIAASAAWRPLGPFGGPAEAIAVNPADPNVLIAVTKNGLLYRSTDKAVHWSTVNFARSFAVSVQAIAVTNESVPVFYLGVADRSTDESGLYRSTDAGSTWQPLLSLRGRAVYSISIWERDPRVVVVGSPGGLYLSRDRGDSWRRISPLALEPITAVALDPQQDNVIYAGTSHLSWKTTDGGASWTSIHEGMLDDSDVFSLEIDRANPQRIFASACSGIYISSNGGELWSKMSGIPYSSRRTYLIRQDPIDRRILYAGTSTGFWKSLDLGATWSRVSSARVKSIAFDPNGRTLYLASENAGLLVSRDRGETIQPIAGGFVNQNVWSISGGENNIYISDGRLQAMRAGEWTPIDSPSWQSDGNLKGIAEIGPETLVAYTRTELFRSTTSGRTWIKLQPIAKSVHMHVLKLVNGEPRSLLAGTSQGLYRSDDFGDNWVKAIPDSSSVDSIFGGSNGSVVVISASRLLLSLDGGRVWGEIPHSVAENELYDLDSDARGVLLAATARGLLRSVDAGKTWSRVDGPLGSGTVHGVLFHSLRPVAFAVQGSAIHMSQDSGQTWTPLDTRDLESVNIRSLAASSGLPNQLFVLTQAKGVFVFDLQKP